MAKLSSDDILKLARLARLDLSDDEVAEYTAELSEILQYVEMLQTVDVTGLEPTNQVSGLVNVTRADEEKDYGYTPEDLLKNVPRVSSDKHIQVKRMLN
jgi:aspartyl-tRNA(Asn)/glutamyl-tRNA(Gln) amidotransferase subunit C